MQLFSNNWTSIVFEGRFKNYGAYEIRTHADTFQLAGLITATTVFTFGICIYFFMIQLHTQRENTLGEIFLDEKKVTERSKQLTQEILKYIDVDMIELQDFLKRIPNKTNNHQEASESIPKNNVIFEKGIYSYSIDPVTGEKYSPKQSASYPGGYSKLYEHVLKDIKFKKITGNANYHYENGDDEIDYEINTMIFIQCEIDEMGKIDSVSIFKGASDPKFNERVLEAFKQTIRWTPALNNGKKVRQTQIIPFHFDYKQPLIKYYRYGEL